LPAFLRVKLTYLHVLLTVISFAENAMLAVASIETSHSPANAAEDIRLKATVAPSIFFNIIFALLNDWKFKTAYSRKRAPIGLSCYIREVNLCWKK